MNDVIQNFNYRFVFMIWKGTYRGAVDGGKACGHGIFTAEGKHAGFRLEGRWEDNVMRRGELKTQGGRRYVGEFADNGSFRGRGELWLNDGVRHFDSEWEQHGVVCYARRGMAVDGDGTVHRVEFMGETGVHWSLMERAFDKKESFRDYGCSSASWSQLPVRLGACRAVARPLDRHLSESERDREGRRKSASFSKPDSRRERTGGSIGPGALPVRR